MKEVRMVSTRIEIEGMHCGACVARVTQALKSVPGAVVEEVTIGSAAVRYDETVTQPESLLKALEKFGFDAKLAAPSTR
jgi:copper chaperone CopZ